MADSPVASEAKAIEDSPVPSRPGSPASLTHCESSIVLASADALEWKGDHASTDDNVVAISEELGSDSSPASRGSPKPALKGSNTLNLQKFKAAALAAKQDETDVATQSRHARFSMDEDPHTPRPTSPEDNKLSLSIEDDPADIRRYGQEEDSGGRRSSILGRLSASLGRSSAMSMWSNHSHSLPSLSAADKVKGLLGGILCALVVWFITSSTLLVLFGIQYYGLVVDDDRERYVASTVERAASAASNVLAAGLAARDAVDFAIRNKLYFEPMDYHTVRVTLEPAFAGFPSLRAVDLAFTDRDDSIAIRRLMGDDESVASFFSTDRAQINVQQIHFAALAMQSSAKDCDVLGERGCMSSFKASTQRWHSLASGLWGGEERDGAREAGDEVFRWDDRPGFVPADPARAGQAPKVAWSAAYSLVFRSVFPGTSGKLSVLGRSVIELSELRADESLEDLTLGGEGAIYICDNKGNVLAANDQGKQVVVMSGNGVFRFRHISEVGGGWAEKLTDFDGSEQTFTEGGFHVAVQPLHGYGLSSFSAVVAAQRNGFIDKRLAPMIEASVIVAVIPYPVFVLTYLGYIAWKEFARRRNLRRVHVLHRGVATLAHEAMPEETMGGDAGHAMTALRKRIINAQMAVARDAKCSMEAYIENSAMGNRNSATDLLYKQIKLQNKTGGEM